MKIYVDIDDTIAEFTSAFLNYLEKEHKIILDRKSLLTHDYIDHLKRSGHIQLKKDIDYVRDFQETSYFKEIVPVKGSQKIIKNLAKNNELVIVTGRPNNLKKETKIWISKFFPNCFSGIYLITQYPRENEKKGLSKEEMCRKLECSLAIDDDPNTIKKISEQGIKTIIFNQPWNKNTNLNGTKRVDNWGEVDFLLNNLSSG